MSKPFDHVFHWKNNPARARLKGKPCRVLGRLRKNTVVVEFEDGEIVSTSRYAIRERDV